MKDFFAMIYEWLLYDQNFNLLFKQLYQGNGYLLLGLSMLFIPLLLFILYYWDSRLPWGSPYRKKYSWIIWLIIAGAITIGVSYYAIIYPELFKSNNPALIQAMNTPQTGYIDFAERLMVNLSVLNGVYSLVTGFLWSLLLKQKSVLHIHIPF
jgi:hypothetical protein